MTNVEYEILQALKEISFYLSGIDDKLGEINSRCADMAVALDDLNGEGIYNIGDVVDKLDDLETAIDAVGDKIEELYE